MSYGRSFFHLSHSLRVRPQPKHHPFGPEKSHTSIQGFFFFFIPHHYLNFISLSYILQKKISNIVVTSYLIDEVFWVAIDRLMRYRPKLTHVSLNVYCFGNNRVSSSAVNVKICESNTFERNEFYRKKKSKQRQSYRSMSTV